MRFHKKIFLMVKEYRINMKSVQYVMPNSLNG